MTSKNGEKKNKFDTKGMKKDDTRDTDASFLQFAFEKILNFVHFLLLLVQEVQDDAHGGLLQPGTLDLVLQPVLHVAQSQGAVNQNHCRGK